MSRAVTRSTRLIILGMSTIVAMLAASVTPARADFDYPDFSGTPTGLNLLGPAQYIVNRLRLNPNVGAQVGAAWTEQQQDISAGFDTTFVFLIAGGGADGFTFCVQNDNAQAIGDQGSGLGYANTECLGTAPPGIISSVAFEFDTWESGICFAEPNGNHISVHATGAGLPNSAEEQYSLAMTTAIPELVDSTAHTVRIEYIVPSTLFVYFDDLTTPVIEANVNIVDLVGGTDVWVGFTASTGGVTEAHDILSWSFTNGGGSTDPEFLRGDADGNGTFTGLIDALFVLNFQFSSGATPPCMKAADADDSGTFAGLIDGIYLLNYQFAGGVAPPAPGPMLCGADPTVDTLSCDSTLCP